MAIPNPLDVLNEISGLLYTLTRARLLVALRPDKYGRMAAAVWTQGMTMTTGFVIAAV